jgi:hypothetical protein
MCAMPERGFDDEQHLDRSPVDGRALLSIRSR